MQKVGICNHLVVLEISGLTDGRAASIINREEDCNGRKREYGAGTA